MQATRPSIGIYPAALALLRPHQWVKNGFVLLGLIFAHQWHDASLVQSVGLVFIAFCAMASAVYVYNDLIDVEADRHHPGKCHRPIASGAIQPVVARALGLALAATALLAAGAASLTALALVTCYAVMNIAYTHRLKHMVIVDVFVISAGFMLRILIGTLGVGIPPSSWLLLCGMMITLFLGFAKRKAELLVCEASGTPARRVLAHYRPEVLDQLLAMTGGCSVLAYALYTVSPETVALHGTDRLIYTVPFLLYGICRYLFLLHGKGHGQDTARDLFSDCHLVLMLPLWLVTTLLIIA
ncbi:4-hydroxybenzoate polyprenyltransferase [Sphaerotilus hippei]|uniref:4-hydroxybenzoate polyprenyltransferase n=1 Tax=Sphaerotilus hippei TaxID=744406 RepID=A0A318H0S2_9BURK|nr:decaprenyl-phosphate phosphoribosyltransferase [Sphaerotilus hippei]PXW94935.1 4-hydroxybenzoate polyprenyltransferase [Sphaerotilus hippei]